MTVSIANMSQVWMSNTNTYNGIALSVSTLGYGANNSSRIFKLRVDGNTKFDIDGNGSVFVANSLTSNSVTSNVVSTDNIANSTGSYVFVNGYPRQPGQIIETLSSVCDGTTITVGSGTYSTQNANAAQVMTAAYANIIGSVISYVPPAGTSRVIYRFDFSYSFATAGVIAHYKFFIDSNEVLYSRSNFSAQGAYPENRCVFEWTIPIGGTPNTNTGRLASWTSAKNLYMQGRYYSGSYYGNWHTTAYWDGAGSAQFSMPKITIMAIA